MPRIEAAGTGEQHSAHPTVPNPRGLTGSPAALTPQSHGRTQGSPPATSTSDVQMHRGSAGSFAAAEFGCVRHVNHLDQEEAGLPANRGVKEAFFCK